MGPGEKLAYSKPQITELLSQATHAKPIAGNETNDGMSNPGNMGPPGTPS